MAMPIIVQVINDEEFLQCRHNAACFLKSVQAYILGGHIIKAELINKMVDCDILDTLYFDVYSKL